jgi:hypothetical protein
MCIMIVLREVEGLRLFSCEFVFSVDNGVFVMNLLRKVGCLGLLCWEFSFRVDNGVFVL